MLLHHEDSGCTLEKGKLLKCEASYLAGYESLQHLAKENVDLRPGRTFFCFASLKGK